MMKDRIKKNVEEQYPDFQIECTENNGKITINAVKDLKKGFDVDYEEESGKVEVSFTSKLRMIFIYAAIGVTALLTWQFGGSLLSAMGLTASVGDTSITLKILYIIPMLIFLIPTMVLSMTASSIINPKDKELLKSVQQKLKEAGIDSEII
jgi:hypothetical protein